MQNAIKHSHNIELNNTGKLFNKGAILTYLKQHKVDLTAYVFAAIVAWSVMLEAWTNSSEKWEEIEQQSIQNFVATQRDQVSNILEKPKLDVQDPKENIITSSDYLQKNNSEYIKSLELKPIFEFDSTIPNAGLGYYDENTWKSSIVLNDQVISKKSQEHLMDKKLYTEGLYANEYWWIEFMYKVHLKDFEQNYPLVNDKYYYYQVVEMMWEYKTLETFENHGTREAIHIFLLRIKEIIYSTWSENQYAMVSDMFRAAFESVFMWSNYDISYTNNGIDKLLTQNYYGNLPYSQISDFLSHIKDNLYSQWINVDDILEQWNISTQIASNSDYTHN